jgi:WD40 repeat protein
MFDPYHKWLGIPKEQRPATYYQLLGISPSETDRDVIEEAAIRQTTHLRAYQIGPHAQECTRLLNEIAQARTTLLNPGLRREYDARLAPLATVAVPARADDAVTAQPPRPAATTFADEFTDLDEPRPTRPHPRSDRRLDVRKSNTVWIIVGSAGAGVVLLIAVVLLFVLLRSSQRPPIIAVKPAPVAPAPKPVPPVAAPQPGQADPQPQPAPMPPQPIPMPQPVILPKVAPGNRLPANLADAPFDAWSIQFPETIGHLAISADGSTVAAGSFQRVYLIDYAKKNWRAAVETPVNSQRAFAMSPNGSLLAIGDKDRLTVWDLTKGNLLQTLPHEGADLVACAAFSSDGAKLATGTQSNDPQRCLVRLWDIAAGKLLWTGVGHQRIITSIVIAAGGDVVSRDVDYSHRRWRGADGGEVRNVVNQRLLRENLGADGRHVVATWQDNRTIELWDMEQNRAVRSFNNGGRFAIRLRWGGDGKTAIAVDDANALGFWDVNQGKLLATRNDHTGQLVTDLAIAGDGRTAVSAGMGNNSVRFWNLARLHNPQAGAIASHDYVTEDDFAKLPQRSALSERVGGEGGGPFYRFQRDGKPLLGFLGAVGNWNNRPMIRLLHPLYGRDHPAPQAGETLLLAKEGYAVGGLNAVGTDYCWAVQVIFCRLDDGKLDLNDSYTSAWLSEPRNDPVRRLGMNGQPALGIFGRQGLNNDALGLILSLPPDAVNPGSKVILKKDDAFAGDEPIDRVFRFQHAKSYSVELRAGQIVNIVAAAGGLQMPLFVRLSTDQDVTVGAHQQRTNKAHLYNFVVPRDGNYRITVVNMIRDRVGPFTLTVTEGAQRPNTKGD